jgi:hypothetical protein
LPYKDPAKNEACKKKWAREHAAEINARTNAYYHSHKELHLGRVLSWRKRNREAWLSYKRDWNKRNRERFYGYALKELYGITREDYDHMLQEQKGRCAICRKPPGNEPRKRLHVDHDHRTGKVRGLLCQICNMRVGTLETFPMVKKALAYLEKHRAP